MIKRFSVILLVTLLSGTSAQATLVASGNVYRDGDTVVVKGDGFCYAIGLDNLKASIADKQWTPLKTLLITGINSVRELTNNEREICFGDNAVPVYVWNVAPSSSGKRPVYLSKRLASGELSKVKTGDYLASDMPCATDENNTYTHGYKGGKRMWRNIRGSVDFIVYCAKK